MGGFSQFYCPCLPNSIGEAANPTVKKSKIFGQLTAEQVKLCIFSYPHIGTGMVLDYFFKV